jgi:hypothetical protein
MKIYSKYSLGVSGIILVLTIAFLYFWHDSKPSWPICVMGVVNIGIFMVFLRQAFRPPDEM